MIYIKYMAGPSLDLTARVLYKAEICRDGTSFEGLGGKDELI